MRSLFQSEIRNTKLQRWSIQIQEYGAPIKYYEGKRNIRADMLSRICVLSPDDYVPFEDDVPTPWDCDNLDKDEVITLQEEEFPYEKRAAREDEKGTLYVLEESILYSISEPYRNAGRYKRLVLPHKYRESVIQRCHEEVAHAGFSKTLMKIQEAYVWPGMRQAVRDYLRLCTRCQILTPQSQDTPRRTMPIPPRPLHTFGVDIVGPFTKSKQGNKYLLTFVDHLTGWGEAYPIKNKSNESVWEKFNIFISQYGIPEVLVSDNGGEFTAKKFQEWLNELGIDHRRTCSHHPQSNGRCERFNGTIQKLLLKSSGGAGDNWESYLPDALYAYRITAKKTGHSPFQQLYGQRPRMPKTKMSGNTPGQRLQNIRSATKVAQAEAQKDGEKYVRKQGSKIPQYKEGDYVSLRVHNATKGFSKWDPGYQIIRVFGPVVYVQKLNSNRTHRVNMQHVRPIEAQLPYDMVNPVKYQNTKNLRNHHL